MQVTVQPIGLPDNISARYKGFIGIASKLPGMARRRFFDAVWFALHETDAVTKVDELGALKQIEEAFDLAELAKDVHTPL